MTASPRSTSTKRLHSLTRKSSRNSGPRRDNRTLPIRSSHWPLNEGTGRWLRTWGSKLASLNVTLTSEVFSASGIAFGFPRASHYGLKSSNTCTIPTLPDTRGETSRILSSLAVFFWPGAAQDVRRFVRNCDTCGRSTLWRDRKQGLLKPLPIPERIWAETSIDFITDLPPSGRDQATNCMVITDRLTKGVILEDMDDISTDAVARKLIKCSYPYHGLPAAITSDRGLQFVR